MKLKFYREDLYCLFVADDKDWGTIGLNLTKEDLKAYLKVEKSFLKWQTKLEKLAAKGV